MIYFIKKSVSQILILFGIIFVFGNIVIIAQPSNEASRSRNYKFTNGNWFDGKSFKSKTFYSINGIFSNKKPKQIDETIDLKNGFVIPPFGDAHTHNLDGTRDLERLSKAYFAEGTFYVQVLANYATGAKQARPLLNKSQTLDVSYANGMLTNTYGHPFMVYEPLALEIYNDAEAFRRVEEIKKSRIGENNAYWFLDSKADVDAKWEKILATKPDIIKIGLLDAENYKKNVADGEINHGLSPEVAEYVVEKAYQANLRIYAHIETANDFRLGVKIGVDGFAHAPDYNWDGKLETKPQDDLTIADIKLAAKRKVVVIPTAARGIYRQTNYDAAGKGTLDQERFARVVERYKKLYNEMHRRGVRLAFGLDTYGLTVMPEIFYFHENKIFDNLTLLKIAVQTTPQTIFPNRKIGLLKNDYEASFLVLENNPLENFDAVKNIKMRFKQGAVITIEPEKEIETNAQQIKVKEINQNGVHGNLYYSENSTNLPTVIVISGSDGGIEFADSFGKPLAEQGYAVLALPYWKYKDLPDKLSQIPLEYFYKAIEILKNERIVDKNRIGIIGYSRGGEGALLLASKSKDIKAVIGLSAGAYVAPNIDFKNWWELKSAWTEKNIDLPFLPKSRNVEKGNWKKVFEEIKSRRNRETLIKDFEETKNDPNFEESAVKVEDINGPVLLISGGLDLVWSAETMSDYIIKRLHEKQFSYFNAHLNYPLAGHDFVSLAFNREITEDELKKKYVDAEYIPGGKIADNLKAGKESWKMMLNFLETNLKSNR